MRTIKFQGIRTDTNEHVTGYYAYKPLSNEHFIITPTYDSGGISRGQYFTDYLVHPESVGQFTGLHDRNGTEIFEGDKVRFADFHDCAEDGVLVPMEGHVIFDRGGYWIDVLPEYLRGNALMDDNEDYEVIGNIYEGEDE